MAVTCNRIDCTNEGTAHPVLELRPRGYTGQPANAVLGIRICDEHQPTLSAQDFITDEGWQVLVETARALGKATPDRASTTLHWEAETPPGIRVQ